MDNTDTPVVTYAIEGYSLGASLDLQTYSPYWGGYSDPDSARRMVRDLGNPRHRFRLVKVTREVVEYLTPPGDDWPEPEMGDPGA